MTPSPSDRRIRDDIIIKPMNSRAFFESSLRRNSGYSAADRNARTAMTEMFMDMVARFRL